MYARAKQPVANALARRFRGLWTAAYHRFYIDEVYQFVTHKIIFGCISRPIAWFDRHVVDGFFDFLAWSANATVMKYAVCKADKFNSTLMYSCWVRCIDIVIAAIVEKC